NVVENNGNKVGIGVSGSVVVHNRVGSNGGGGILCGSCTIQENVITLNGNFGISDGAGTLAVPPTIGARNVVIGNVIERNAGRGIESRRRALIANNSVSGNATDGILCGAACTLNENAVDRNNTSATPGSGGVTVADGSSLHANTISYNEGFGLRLPGTANAS